MSNVSSSNGIEKYPKLRFPEFKEPWTTTQLSNFFKKNIQKNSNGTITNVISNSAKNGLIPQKEYFDKDIANADNTSGYYIISKNDFVYNPRKSSDAPYGPIRRYTYDEDGIVSPLYLCFRGDSSVNPEFFEKYFKSPVWHRYIYMSGDSGARHDRVSIKDDTFFEMPINLPCNEEQNKISSFLALVEQKIEAQTILVENLKIYKRGLINKIFSHSSSWIEYAISEVGTVITGNTPSTNNAENYIGNKLFCAPGDLGQCKYISKTEKNISEVALNSNRKIPKGSILVTCIGSTIGKLGIANEEMLTNQQINSIIANSTHCNEFIYYALEYNFPRFLSHVGKQAVPILSKGQFEDLSLLLPAIEEQKKYAMMFSLLDTKIEQSIEVLNNLNCFKSSLLQQLFI